jgi:methionyl-tRNA formyltransferase
MIAKTGWWFFLQHAVINIWQTFFLKFTKLIIPKKWRKEFEISEMAEKRKIPYLEVDNINEIKSLDWIKKIAPDYLVSCLLLQIMKKEILAIPKKATINFHPALSHNHRGIFSSFWAIFHGKSKSGATIHFVNEKIDQGEIILVKSFFIQKSDSVFCVNRKSAVLGGKLLVRALKILQEKKRFKKRKFKWLRGIFSYPSNEQIDKFFQHGKNIIHWRDLWRK